jgi:DNA helicase II / ATP-dependent DNA helicase PcrA
VYVDVPDRDDVDVGALLTGLDADQRAAVTASESLIAVIAGAGSGKTTVLTRRIAYRVATGLADERHVLVVTFTRQAAAELRRRLYRSGLRDGITAGTFHKIAFAILRQRWADTNRAPMSLLNSRKSLLSELANPVGRGHRRQAGPSGVDVPAVLGEIDWAKARLITPARYLTAARSAGRRPGLPADAIVELFAAYEREKKRRRVVDFDDLLAHCLDELARDPAFADATRWRFRHLFVDEFQDVNPLQHALLEAIRGGRPDLCVVGDPRQSIYGWNGSEPALLERIGDHYPAVRIVRLDRNYRSTPQIVAAAAGVLTSGDDLDAPVAVRSEGVAVSWRSAADETAEATMLTDIIWRLRPPDGRWSSTAVLARTNAQLGPISDALAAALIPLRSASRQRQRHDPDIAQLLNDVKSISGGVALATWAADLEEAPPDGVVTPARHQLAGEIRTFLTDSAGPRGRADGRAFLDWRLLAHHDDEPDDGVELLTFHAAKGRQWRSVIVTGVEAGMVPHYTAISAAQQSEESRLLYVACTRAEDALVITWAETRGGRVSGPSSLIGEQAVSLPDRVAVPVRPQIIHRSIMSPPDAALVALRRWRSSTARAAALPESFVCSDETLAAIAAARPTSADALVAIPGMSPLAVARFGERILTAVASGA